MELLTGLLEKNEVYTAYEDKVYERLLTLRLRDETLIEIIDRWLISTDVLPGNVYSLLISLSLPRQLLYFPTRPSNLPHKQWEGIIINRHWAISNQVYRWLPQEWVGKAVTLVETPLGYVATSESEFKVPIHVNGFVQWEDPEFDLIAIV